MTGPEFFIRTFALGMITVAAVALVGIAAWILFSNSLFKGVV